jgi:hypothetical protein
VGAGPGSGRPRWAQRFTQGIESAPKGFRRDAAPDIVRHTVLGIAQACIPDPDTTLHDLLTGAIEDCAAWVRCGPDPLRAAPSDAAPAANGLRIRAYHSPCSAAVTRDDRTASLFN